MKDHVKDVLRDKGNDKIQSITQGGRLSISLMRVTLRLTITIRFDVVGEGNQHGETLDI